VQYAGAKDRELGLNSKQDMTNPNDAPSMEPVVTEEDVHHRRDQQSGEHGGGLAQARCRPGRRRHGDKLRHPTCPPRAGLTETDKPSYSPDRPARGQARQSWPRLSSPCTTAPRTPWSGWT
jgi:hypothetical protein